MDRTKAIVRCRDPQELRLLLMDVTNISDFDKVFTFMSDVVDWPRCSAKVRGWAQSK
jgi:hypothetical protein